MDTPGQLQYQKSLIHGLIAKSGKSDGQKIQMSALRMLKNWVQPGLNAWCFGRIISKQCAQETKSNNAMGSFMSPLIDMKG